MDSNTQTNSTSAAATGDAPLASVQVQMRVRGKSFYDACRYIGSLPLRRVVQLRQGLKQIQLEQNCLNPAALPEFVTLAEGNTHVLLQFLMDCPCDDVFDILHALETDLQEYMKSLSDQALREAAEKVIEQAPAATAAQESVQPVEPAGQTLVPEAAAAATAETSANTDTPVASAA